MEETFSLSTFYNFSIAEIIKEIVYFIPAGNNDTVDCPYQEDVTVRSTLTYIIM